MMRSFPAFGLREVLRTWLQTWSGAFRQSPAVPHADNAGPAAPAAGRAVHVLVVDDNPLNLMMMSELMQLRGLVPTLAADGAEAVALVSARSFDLILMDLQMPILDGLKATAAIRRLEFDSARPAVPVIAYTTTAPCAGVLETHGMNGRLSKPCADQELDDCLQRWCPAHNPALARLQGKPRDARR